MMQHASVMRGNYFLQYPHSIIDRCPFGPDALLIFEHFQKEFKESKMSIEDGEEMVAFFVRVWLEFSMLEVDEEPFF